jgi:hypothetical protein
MTQFIEGQDIEVARAPQGARPTKCRVWEKAEIVERRISREYSPGAWYCVQFHDGTRGVFAAAHIRAETRFSRPGFDGPYEGRP